MILALVGMPGAGKSVAAAHFMARGLRRVYFGDIVLKELEARGLALTAENERMVREDLRRVHGMGAMALLAQPTIRHELAFGAVVIDGLYSFSEYQILLREFADQLIVIALVSTRAVRYERLARRLIRPLTRREAEARDFAEIEHLEKGGPIALADYTLINDGDPEMLAMALDELLQQLQKTARENLNLADG